MARKRYLSTNISTDPRIAKLAKLSEFAVLLYTWMIPHADDAGTLTGDAEELLLLVMPGFRWRTRDDVVGAIQWLLEFGLLEQAPHGRLRFPSRPFYTYQAYIGPGRRNSAQPAQHTVDNEDVAQNGADQRNAPDSTQNSAPFKLTSSFKSPVTNDPVPTELSVARAKRSPPVDEAFILEMVTDYGRVLGGEDGVRDSIAGAMNHKASDKAKNKQLYVQRWLTRECEFKAGRQTGTGNKHP